MEISIILPAYKEAENLVTIIPALHKVLEGMDIEFEILVIDTIQPMDNAKQVCQEYGAVYLPRKDGNFYGDAIRTGISAAQGRYIVVMDADGSHNPEVIKKFYKEILAGNDVVIGSRYCKGGNSHNSFILKFMSWALNVTYRVIFGLKVKDVSDSFRMYRAKQLKALTLECQNFDIVEEILIRLMLKKPTLKIKEVPIYFEKRAYGESKRDLVKFVRSYLKTIHRLIKIKRQERKAQKHRRV